LHLKAVLPEYMVPSAVVTLAALPLNSNGKLDRRSLPAPEVGAYAHRQYEAPQGEFEETLGAIWQRVLHVDRVGRHDNFFELGGHSLHGIQLVVQVEQRFHVRLSLVAVFRHPSIREMAQVVESLQWVHADSKLDEAGFEPGADVEEGTLDGAWEASWDRSSGAADFAERR
jgi:acyl carrier protein